MKNEFIGFARTAWELIEQRDQPVDGRHVRMHNTQVLSALWWAEHPLRRRTPHNLARAVSLLKPFLVARAPWAGSYSGHSATEVVAGWCMHGLGHTQTRLHVARASGEPTKQPRFA